MHLTVWQNRITNVVQPVLGNNGRTDTAATSNGNQHVDVVERTAFVIVISIHTYKIVYRS